MQLRSPPKALHNIKQYFVILCYSFIVGKIQNIESQGALQTDLNIKKNNTQTRSPTSVSQSLELIKYWRNK